MAENRFNLIDEQWIPVTDRGKVGLRTIFSDETITALGGNPVEKIAVFKLLLAIAQSAYTPENEADWEKVGAKGLQQKVLEYLDAHYDCFWLYGEKPFLQMKEVKAAEQDLKKRKDLQMNGMFPDFFADNNTVITEYDNKDISNSDEDKALFLICLLNFSFYGKQVNNDISLHKDFKKGVIAKPGASLGFANYLHTFGFLNSILKSIYYNLQTLNGNWVDILGDSKGKPFWEEMPTSEKCPIAIESKKTLIGHLVPLSRFVLFEENRIIVTEGIVYHYSEAEKKSGKSSEPWKELNISFIQKNADDIVVIPADVSKKPWRFITSILVKKVAENKFTNLGVQLFIERIRREINFPFILWSGGLSVGGDSFGKKIKENDDYVESKARLNTKIYGAIEEDDKEDKSLFFINLQSELQKMDRVAKDLGDSIKGYISTLSGSSYKNIGEKQSILSKQKFWQLCEGKFQRLIDICEEENHADFEKKSEKLRKEIRAYAQQIYDEQCPNLTARQLEAWAKSRPNFVRKNKENS